MKIEKRLYYDGSFEYYYIDSKTDFLIEHSLYNDYSWWGVGYRYHDQQKGFWLSNIKYIL